MKVFSFADEAGESLNEQIKAIKENNLDGLEIRGIDGKSVVKLNIDEAKEIRKKLDDNDISVWSIGSPIGKINVNDNFQNHLDVFKHSLEIANILGASRYRLFSFFVNGEFELHDEVVFSYLTKLCEEAKGTGIVLCHENEKDIYGDVASRCVKIFDNVPDLKAVFDFANFIQCGEDVLYAWEQLAEYVDYIHIKDALPNGVVVPAGEGVGNIETILKDYKARGGNVVTLEPHLFDFIGFDKLEHGEIERKYSFDNSRQAFDAAANSLKKILEKI